MALYIDPRTGERIELPDTLPAREKRYSNAMLGVLLIIALAVIAAIYSFQLVRISNDKQQTTLTEPVPPGTTTIPHVRPDSGP